MTGADSSLLRGCLHCGLVQAVPQDLGERWARCARCGSVVVRPSGPAPNRLSAAWALAALICYPVGIGLPVLQIRQMGYLHEASIWTGTVELLSRGQWFVGGVVLICSLVVPILKLTGLLFLIYRADPAYAAAHASIYRWIERLGRWGMIDVLLVAILVAAVKIGDWVSVSPGPGAMAFGACVLFSLLASACFQPQALWEKAR